jgi:hypothetical protein
MPATVKWNGKAGLKFFRTNVVYFSTFSPSLPEPQNLQDYCKESMNGILFYLIKFVVALIQMLGSFSWEVLDPNKISNFANNLQ